MNIKASRITKITLSLLLLSLLTISTLQSIPVHAALGSVNFIAEDTTTGGDWRYATGSPVGTYGSYARILPNPDGVGQEVRSTFSVPLGFDIGDPSTWHLLLDPPYNWTGTEVGGLPFAQPNAPYTDEYVPAPSPSDPPVTYFINGTEFIPGDPWGPLVIQYPAFEWNWTDWHTTQTDHREVYYNNILGTCAVGYKFNAWDDGGERSQPTHGYINITMHFPNGTYLLSLYAYDYETIRASQEYRIYDETGTMLLASRQISGAPFDNGAYEIFRVEAPDPSGLTIIVQVYNDAGHPDNTVNVLLSGIFVDRLLTSTGGFLSPIDQFTLLPPTFLGIGLGLALIVPAAFIIYAKQKKKKQA